MMSCPFQQRQEGKRRLEEVELESNLFCRGLTRLYIAQSVKKHYGLLK